jgi:glycosyltransferase involved in cell wall biosynthesis
MLINTLYHELILSPLLDINSAWTNSQKITAYCQQNPRLEPQLDLKDDRDRNQLKILLLLPYPPYPTTTGAAIRRFEHIKYLGKRHHLAIVSFINSHLDYADLDAVQDRCDLSIAVRRRKNPFRSQQKQLDLITEFRTERMKKILEKLNLVDFDLVLFDSIFMAQYYYLFPNSFKILTEHNIESMSIERTIDIMDPEQLDCVKKARSQLNCLKKHEDELWSQFPLRTVVSELDRQVMNRRCQIGETIVVSNGIDTQQIQPVHHINPNKILFMGLMSYEPNIDAILYFIERIFPLVLAREPNTRLCIAGRDPVQKIYNLSKDLPIEIIANPVDMSEVARECIMSIVPLRIGGGTRIKILHSMAMGLPVISTTLGCEGLKVINDVHLLIRDLPTEFAEAIVRVQQDVQLSQNLQIAGRHLVETEYDWDRILREFEMNMLHHSGANFQVSQSK